MPRAQESKAASRKGFGPSRCGAQGISASRKQVCSTWWRPRRCMSSARAWGWQRPHEPERGSQPSCVCTRPPRKTAPMWDSPPVAMAENVGELHLRSDVRNAPVNRWHRLVAIRVCEAVGDHLLQDHRLPLRPCRGNDIFAQCGWRRSNWSFVFEAVSRPHRRADRLECRLCPPSHCAARTTRLGSASGPTATAAGPSTHSTMPACFPVPGTAATTARLLNSLQT